MKRRLSALEHLGLAAVLAAWTSLSWASARLTAVEFPQGGENPSQIVLKVAGDAPEITALSFPEARQGVIVIHKAELGMDTLSWNPRGTWLKSMALRKVDSGAEGQGGVQVTLDLAPGVEFQSHVQQGEIVISLKDAQSAPSAAAVQPVDKDKALDLSNKDFEGLAPAQSSSVNAGETLGGQDAKAPPPSTGAYRPEIAPKKNVLTEEEKEELLNQAIFQQRVNLDFKDAELQNVIRLLAARTNLNIILTRDQVKGTITLKLTNVRLGVALDAILKTNNLAYLIEPGGIVRIVPISQVRTEKVEKRMVYIPINWIRAASVSSTLSSFKSSEGTIQADTEANGIIITDVPAKVEQIVRLIEKMDIPEKQVMIEARLVDITDEAQRNMGIDWTLRRVTGYDASKNPIYDDSLRVSEGSGGRDSIATSGNKLGFFGNDYDLAATLDFFERRSQATVLANPRVVTLNNLIAKIDILRKIPYLSAQQTGQNQIGTVEFKEAGVTLEVVPNVTNNGYVRMTLKPEQKVRKGDFIGPAGAIPIIDERKVESSLIVKDEENVVLGGLRQIDNSNAESGVPWILRVPVLGWFFKSQNTSHSKTELVLFVTPHIIKDPTLTRTELQEYEQIDYNWDLPDYFYDQTQLRTEAPAKDVTP